MAHLICELYLRLNAVGLADGGRIELPFTQAELGDTFGLSSVHVNRMLQELRARNLIATVGKTYEILDFEALRGTALFNSNYLDLEAVRVPGRPTQGQREREAAQR